MPGKTARALCPVCQEPMPPDETECENCGAFVIDEAVVRLSRAFGIPREKALALFEKGFRHPKQLQDRDVDDVLERGENGLLFLCTNCGGFVAAGDQKCPRCGAEFETEEPAPPEEKDILDLVLCPVCGADNSPVWKECEICGEPLDGTEEPPGGILASTEGADRDEPMVPRLADDDRVSAPDPSRLQQLDDILSDLENPAPDMTRPAVRPRQKIPKIARPAKRPEAPPKLDTPRATTTRHGSAWKPPRPRARPTIRPIPKPVTAPPASPAAGTRRVPPHPAETRRRPPPPRRSNANRPLRRRRWMAPPAEFTGGMTVAAAATLFASRDLGEVGVAWGVVFVLLVLAVYVLAATLARKEIRVGGTDVLLLTAGALLGALAPVVSEAVAPVMTVAGAAPLAFATRRLLRTPARDLVAVASCFALAALGASAALESTFASTSAWALGLLAAVPWPGGVAAVGLLQRHSSVALQRELTKAERNLARRDYRESVKDFDRAIAVGAKGTPGEELPWYGKGASLILLGRYDEALQAIDKALDLNPRNEVAWLNKGNALTKMGRLIDALRCFNAALKVNLRYEVAWNNKGNTLARLGHFEEALACYQRALAIDPEYRGAWVNKGYVLTKLGRYDEATSCADRVLQLNETTRSRTA